MKILLACLSFGACAAAPALGAARVAFQEEAPPAAEPAFRALGLEEALSAAQAEQKPVLVQFYAEWDVRSQELGRTLWKDPGVLDWVRGSTVAIRLDTDRAKPELRTYEVGITSTSLFLASDGRELDRFVHAEATKPETFLEAAAAIVAGQTSIQVARAALLEAPDDPLKQVEYAYNLAVRGRTREAIERYFKTFDEAWNHAEFSEYRRTTLIAAILQLDAELTPSRVPLLARADAARADVLAGREAVRARLPEGADDAAVDQLLASLAQDFAAIQRPLGMTERSYDLFDLVKDKPHGPVVRKALSVSVLPFLAHDRRYPEMLELIGEPRPFVETELARFRAGKAAVVPQKGRPTWVAEAALARELRERVAVLFEAVVGSGQKEEARRIAGELLEADPSGEMYADLVRRARRGGDAELGQALADQAFAKFPESSREVRRVQRALRRSVDAPDDAPDEDAAAADGTAAEED